MNTEVISVDAMRNDGPIARYSKATDEGRDKFNSLVDQMRTTGNVMLMTHYIREMVEDGTWDGFKAGFAQRIAESLI